MINHFFVVYSGNEQTLYRKIVRLTDRSSMQFWTRLDRERPWRDTLVREIVGD